MADSNAFRSLIDVWSPVTTGRVCLDPANNSDQHEAWPILTIGEFGIFRTGLARWPFRIECLICGAVVNRITPRVAIVWTDYDHLAGLAYGKMHPQSCLSAMVCQGDGCQCDNCAM